VENLLSTHRNTKHNTGNRQTSHGRYCSCNETTTMQQVLNKCRTKYSRHKIESMKTYCCTRAEQKLTGAQNETWEPDLQNLVIYFLFQITWTTKARKSGLGADVVLPGYKHRCHKQASKGEKINKKKKKQKTIAWLRQDKKNLGINSRELILLIFVPSMHRFWKA